nr:M43 family zinc metalloprotease [uncultured Fluviicola sp.]
MKTVLLLFTGFFLQHAFTQTGNCGTDGMHNQLTERFPEYREKENQNNQLLYNFLTSDHGNQEKTIYTIPIVFHIMHQGGPENVSDATIIQTVDELNQRFQNSGPYFDATGHVVDIQFCLASIDPWGNPTTGITHDYSSILTLNYYDYVQDWTFKTQNRWNPLLYLNVWTVGNIAADPFQNPSGVGGYGTFPGGMVETDGIVGRYNFFALNSSLLAHEVGHYLNLQHTFSNGCINFNCMLNGDYVCDTPPDNSNDNFTCQGNSCSTEMSDTSGFNPFSGDMQDLPNYMDYTSCPLSFTQGQTDRMEAALTQLRPTLLQSNGCGMHPGGAVPVALFTVDSSTFCKGTGKYGFLSTGANCLYAAWDFDNNGSVDTVGEQVVHRFSSSGTYSVKLIVSGYGGSDTLTQTIHVFVAPSPYYPISGSISGTSIDPILHVPYACIGSLVNIGGAPGMVDYQWSNGATTQNNMFNIDSTTELSLTVTTPSGEQLHSCQPFKIGVNPRIHLAFQTGSDTVGCGELVVLRWYPIPYWFPATNTWYRNGQWFSANQTVLGNYGTPAGDQDVWVANNVDPIGCVTNSDTIHFFVRDPIPVSLSFDGAILRTSYDCLTNLWFRDGVQIPGSDSSLVVTQNGCYWSICVTCAYLTTDTICITNLSLDEHLKATEIQLFPNPVSEILTIQFSIPQQNTWIEILDPTGKLIRRVIINGSDFSFKREGLSAGAYLIHLLNDASHLNQVRFVIIE